MPSQTVDFLYTPASALAGLYVSLVSNVDGVTKYSATTTSDLNGRWLINPKPPAGTYALYTGNAQGVLTTLVDPDFVVDPFNDDGTAVFPKQVTIAAGGLVVTAGGINVTGAGIIAGSLTVQGAVLSLTAAPGELLMSGAGQAIIGGGTTGLAIWNNGLGAKNVDITDAGLMTVRAGVVVTAGGVTVTAGGLTVSAGNINIAAGALLFGAAASIVVPGATGLFINNNANNQTNAAVLDAGPFQVRTSVDLLAAGQLLLGPAGGNASSVAIRSPAKSLIVGTTLTALGAGAQTLTAAQLLGGEIEHTVTGAVADTFDTGANLDAAVPNAAVGDTFICILTVLGAFTVTLTAAAGITLRGTAAVVGTAAGKVCVLTLRRTGVNAWTVYAATGA